jgi:hypothetical protein
MGASLMAVVRLPLDATHILLAAVAIVLVLLWAVPVERRRRAALRAYWIRSCAGRYWRRTFPDASTDELRMFLRDIEVAFGLTHEQVLKLAPSDRLFGLYRAFYPDRNMPDALEIETLAKLLRKHYGFDIREPMHNEITFGELFARARTRAA